MSGTFKLAWRSIWRNRRRTLISMSAVGLGLTLVILYSGFMTGVMTEAVDELDATGMGHVEIYAQGWRPRHGAAQALEHPQALLGELKLPPGAQVGSRVVSRGLASSAHGSAGVELLGVDWTAEKQLSAHLNHLVAGALPAPDDRRGMLIGDKLAERLKVAVDGKVRVMVQRADGEMGADLYRVRGIYHSISPALASREVYVNTGAAQALVGLGDAAHEIVIQLPRAELSDAVAARARAALGTGVEVVTWAQLLPMMKAMETFANKAMTVAALFVYFLVGLGILNTILMSVMERTREFGVMLAVGTRPRRIVSLVLAESFWIGTISAVVGLALGLLLTWYGSTHPLDMSAAGESYDLGGATIGTLMHAAVNVPSALKATVYVYVMALIVGLYPAWRVARLRPAEAVRHT